MAVKRGKKQARRNGQSSVPGWMWLLVWLLVGAVVALVLYVKMPHTISDLIPHPNPTAHPATAGDSGVAPEGSVARAAPAEPKKTEFDFFKVLPEREVVIPDEELSAQVKAEAAAKLASQQQAVPPTTPVVTNGASP
ncbi:MAG: SPOR domain-containing protein, partial [Lysobacteraceae bacterium]